MQRRVERTVLDMRTSSEALDGLRDRVAVRLPKLQRAEDQQIEPPCR